MNGLSPPIRRQGPSTGPQLPTGPACAPSRPSSLSPSPSPRGDGSPTHGTRPCSSADGLDATHARRRHRPAVARPVDHADHSAGTFEQRLTLLHTGAERPTILATTGYEVPLWPRRTEPAIPPAGGEDDALMPVARRAGSHTRAFRGRPPPRSVVPGALHRPFRTP
ncbi:hypothetical protein AB0O67_03385 [Streptomyces sp. NPDC086077]|uniref:hypothetical protein n=1 Tax=Streptomyces sp. NPDC086077 TaxID=3154862 RepID=UPI003433BECF